jgi:hypothetical protein
MLGKKNKHLCPDGIERDFNSESEFLFVELCEEQKWRIIEYSPVYVLVDNEFPKSHIPEDLYKSFDLVAYDIEKIRKPQ